MSDVKMHIKLNKTVEYVYPISVSAADAERIKSGDMGNEELSRLLDNFAHNRYWLDEQDTEEAADDNQLSLMD